MKDRFFIQGIMLLEKKKQWKECLVLQEIREREKDTHIYKNSSDGTVKRKKETRWLSKKARVNADSGSLHTHSLSLILNCLHFFRLYLKEMPFSFNLKSMGVQWLQNVSSQQSDWISLLLHGFYSVFQSVHSVVTSSSTTSRREFTGIQRREGPFHLKRSSLFLRLEMRGEILSVATNIPFERKERKRNIRAEGVWYDESDVVEELIQRRKRKQNHNLKGEFNTKFNNSTNGEHRVKRNLRMESIELEGI